MRFLSCILLLVSFSTSAQDEAAIREVLSRQVDCWNDGDIECFMEGYWKSEKLAFVGSKGVTYGWRQTLDNYKERYPSREAMGELSFELKVLEPISEDFWFVIGKWNLDRVNDNPNGHFTLIFRRLGGEWVIVSDHTS